LPQLHKRTRCKSKHEKDKARLDFQLERQRLFQEAFHDNIDSIGEVDALTGSEALDVNRGDVSRDPKLSYIHPCLNQDRSLGNAARLCMKKLRMKRPELGNKKREREGWWTGLFLLLRTSPHPRAAWMSRV
jgi:hypothetical protein